MGNHPQIQWHNHNNHLFGFKSCTFGKATWLCSMPKLGWLHWKLQNPVSRWHLHTTDKLVIALTESLVGAMGQKPWSSSCGPLLGLLRFPQSMVAVFQEQASPENQVEYYPWLRLRASLVSQLVKNPPAMQETSVRSLGGEDPLAKGMATHSSILAWGIPWTVSLGFTKSWTQLSDFLFHLRSHTAFFCHRHNPTQIQREGIPRPLPVNGRSVKDIFRRAHGMGFIWVQPFSENIICLTC